MIFSPTEKDIQQLEGLGLTIEQVQHQFDNFKNGFPYTKLESAASVSNGGIRSMTDKQISFYERQYRVLAKGKKIVKFVPASGAATRMFKDLYSFSSTYFGVVGNFEKEYPEVKKFLENIRSFAFFNDLKECMAASDLDIEEYLQRGDYPTIINYLLKGQYLAYGELPKALLKFHRYGMASRTPLEEHMVEGVLYAKNSDDSVLLHFTISPEHRAAFRRKVKEVKYYYESVFGVRIEVSFSEQKHYTDTIAVDEMNNPVRDKEGNLVFRPAGHGALIENLQQQRADIIFIKNIDNVVPDWMKHTTVIYKKVLAGVLLDTQERVFAMLRRLDEPTTSKDIEEIRAEIKSCLGIELPAKSSKSAIKKVLNRPIRVCGMVKNQGEPGGGPFYTINQKGERSLQIVEAAQINHRDPQQERIFLSATHFNPVDLVVSTKNYKGRYFNLRKYVDGSTGFISKKSQGATVVKSQELPGLWNGSMADWISIFVEVPIATFSPVKTVNDLLRKEHLES